MAVCLCDDPWVGRIGRERACCACSWWENGGSVFHCISLFPHFPLSVFPVLSLLSFFCHLLGGEAKLPTWMDMLIKPQHNATSKKKKAYKVGLKFLENQYLLSKRPLQGLPRTMETAFWSLQRCLSTITLRMAKFTLHFGHSECNNFDIRIQ